MKVLDNELDQLAFEFFKIFAQYEYALKRTGYTRFRNGKIFLDWDRYAREKGQLVWELRHKNQNLLNAIEYLLKEPPKKQILIEGKLCWKDASRGKTVDDLFAHVRRVRNNLFHGGKFGGEWLAPDRSRELINNSLIILRAQKMADEKIREAIDGSKL